MVTIGGNMNIGINSLFQIKQIRDITDESLTVIELDETSERYPFKNWTDTRMLSYCYKDDGNSTSIYPWVDTMAIDQFETYADTLNGMVTDRQNVIDGLVRADTLTEAQIVELLGFYPQYEIGNAYTVGDLFKYDNALYEVIQAHTSQAEWIPKDLPSLYKIKTPSLVIPEWVQPTGSTDAYNIGDRVIFENQVYESLINANTWSPTAYPQGWKLI